MLPTSFVIQKSKNKRKAILPKEPLVKLHLSQAKTNSPGGGKSSKKLVLPKLNDEILNSQLNAAPSTAASIQQQQQTNEHANDKLLVHSQHNSSAKENFLKNLAREFFLDCKQRLDFKTYKNLLQILVDHHHERSSTSGLADCITLIHNSIKQDERLCSKFSAFLALEQSLKLNLFDQTLQYEKSFEFLMKLDSFVTNKCALKKIIQMIIANATITNETDKLSNKIDEIKARLKTITKNNQFFIAEFDYLFDQRLANPEPVYESISLVDDLDEEPLRHVNDSCEFIDLTKAFSSYETAAFVKSNKSSVSTGRQAKCTAAGAKSGSKNSLK
jgi:hypothetical protein